MTTTTASFATSRRPAFAAIGRFVRSHAALSVAIGLFGILAVLIVVGPFFLASPNTTNPAERLQGPSIAYLLGTDGYGRDVLSRVVTGGRVSLGLALLVTLSAGIIGTIVGLVSGFYLRADAVLMRVMDALLAFPGIVLAIALSFTLGAGILSELVALTAMFTPYLARVVRSRVLALRTRTYIEAARVGGMSSPKILLVHVLPNTISTVVVQVVILSASAILIDGALSFLGLGVAPPTATWGNMIAEGRGFMTIAPHLIIVPGVAIVVTVILLNLIGNGMRGVIDPRVRMLNSLQRLRTKNRIAE
jgi:peptide/nickel transport system permease protein